MKKLVVEEVKEIEKKILIEIDRFAEKEGLEYFLAYGTLIGAVRHSGFIPWDDDIDIFMPRESYDKFIKIFNEETSDYKVINITNTTDYPYAFSKVIDRNTVIDEFRFKKYEAGIYVDVFPLDFVGNDINKIIKWDKRINLRRILLKYKTLRSSYYKGINRIILIILKSFLVFINTRNLIISIENESKKIKKNTNYVAFMAMRTYGPNEIYNSDWFRSYIKLGFEGYMFRVPVEYKKVLESTYGDYMKLPPIEKQITHHSFDAWIK